MGANNEKKKSYTYVAISDHTGEVFGTLDCIDIPMDEINCGLKIH